MNFWKILNKTPFLIKLLLALITFPIGIILIPFLSSFASVYAEHSEITEKCDNIKKNPCDETVRALFDYVNKQDKKFKITIGNFTSNIPQIISTTINRVMESNNVSDAVKQEYMGFLIIRKIISYNAVNYSRPNTNYNSRNYNKQFSNENNFFQQGELNNNFEMEQFPQNENKFSQQCEQSHNVAMEESQKAVTPFDHGGYVQGNGFNPSDTMAAEAQSQMDNMNQMNDTGMF